MTHTVYLLMMQNIFYLGGTDISVLVSVNRRTSYRTGKPTMCVKCDLRCLKESEGICKYAYTVFVYTRL